MFQDVIGQAWRTGYVCGCIVFKSWSYDVPEDF